MAYMTQVLRRDEFRDQVETETRFDERLAALSRSGKRPVAARPPLFVVRTRPQHPEG